jgi:hypothetical protein
VADFLTEGTGEGSVSVHSFPLPIVRLGDFLLYRGSRSGSAIAGRTALLFSTANNAPQYSTLAYCRWTIRIPFLSTDLWLVNPTVPTMQVMAALSSGPHLADNWLWEEAHGFSRADRQSVSSLSAGLADDLKQP